MSSILVIEDDNHIQKALHRLFTVEGYEVRCASDGRIGLDCFQTSLPDAVVLDLMLPVMDGLTFIQEARKVPDCQSIPIVVLTAKDLTAEDRRGLGSSVRKVLQKGAYKRDDLLREIRC